LQLDDLLLRHLARCKHCQALLESLARTLAQLRSLAEGDLTSPLPATTVDIVLERIRREPR
jgi:hypothetical protein